MIAGKLYTGVQLRNGVARERDTGATREEARLKNFGARNDPTRPRFTPN